MDKEKALKNQGSEFREDYKNSGGGLRLYKGGQKKKCTEKNLKVGLNIPILS